MRMCMFAADLYKYNGDAMRVQHWCEVADTAWATMLCAGCTTDLPRHACASTLARECSMNSWKLFCSSQCYSMICTTCVLHPCRQGQHSRPGHAVCSATVAATSPSRHTRSRRTQGKEDKRSSVTALQSDNERLKAELQRVQKELHMKDLS